MGSSEKKKVRLRTALVPNGCSRNVNDLTKLAIKHAHLYMGAVLVESDVQALLAESFNTGDEQLNAQLAAEWGEKHFDSDLPRRCLNECTEASSRVQNYLLGPNWTLSE